MLVYSAVSFVTTDLVSLRDEELVYLIEVYRVSIQRGKYGLM